MKVRYGSAKVKALQVLADAAPGALPVRSICIYTGIEYRVMSVSILKWNKQGMVLKGTAPNFLHRCGEAVYKLTPRGVLWLQAHSVEYAVYLAELDAWQRFLADDSLNYWLRLGFNEFQIRFPQLVVVNR